ncbi:MAG: hypothetical protein WBB25_19535 [Sulfitobacter sp.]
MSIVDTGTKSKTTSHVDDLENSWSQVVFIAVGFSIIVGGLWLLYNSGGPYHPGDVEADTQFQFSNDS